MNFQVVQLQILDHHFYHLINQDKSDVQLFTIDTTNVAVSDWNVVGGMSISETKGSIRASWFDDETCHKLRVAGYYKNGIGFEDVFIIKEVKQ